MEKTKERLWAHLAVALDPKTGLYHGAIYRNHPYPSGGDRFLLDKTTKKGWLSPRRAAEEINNFVEREGLEIELLDLDKIKDVAPIPDLSGLPSDVTFTLVTPHNRKEKPYVEIWLGRDTLIKEVDLDPDQLKCLALREIVDFDSSSGRDPELSARYDHYFFTEKGLEEREKELA